MEIWSERTEELCEREKVGNNLGKEWKEESRIRVEYERERENGKARERR